MAEDLQDQEQCLLVVVKHLVVECLAVRYAVARRLCLMQSISAAYKSVCLCWP